MKIIKYFFEFLFIYTLLIIFKIIGYKAASNLGEKIGILIGPLFRSKKKIEDNLKNSNIGNDDIEREKIITGEATPSYPYHPHTLQRIAQVIPQVKLIVILRNPIDRAYALHSKAVRQGKENLSFEADVVLIATGRIPNTQNLGLDTLGIKLSQKGEILVNNNFETNVSNIYAIGDVIPGPMLAHKAEEDGIAAVEIMSGVAGHVNYDLVPGIVYTSPEVATLGKTEDELKESQINYNKGVFPFSANSRARAINHTDGFVKILSDKNSDKVLGVHIIGHEAGNLVHEVATAMSFGGSAEDIARTCHGHPTLNEAVKEAALAAGTGAIHI